MISKLLSLFDLLTSHQSSSPTGVGGFFTLIILGIMGFYIYILTEATTNGSLPDPGI